MITISNILNSAKMRFSFILIWLSEKWSPCKNKIINSKIGLKYPKSAKFFSNGIVISVFIFVFLISGRDSSDPYQKYNNSTDYKSCMYAAKDAGRKMARISGSDVGGTIIGLQTSCEKDGATQTIDQAEAFNDKAMNPICVNQVRSAKDSCMGARSDPNTYLQCIKSNTPACPN